MPFFSRKRRTPEQASRPKALPPARTTRVDLLGQVQRVEQVPLLAAGGRAANVDAGHRARFAQHDGAAGQRLEVADVAHLDARDVG